MLRGGLDKLHEAGVALAGGHSVDDPELKYGLVGDRHRAPRSAIWTQAGRAARRRAGAHQAARHRDRHHRAQGRPGGAEARARRCASMAALNRQAAELLAEAASTPAPT